jgi:hypothetical protein
MPLPRQPQRTLSRLISFRISESDYQTLLDSREELKVASVSEAAREMVCTFLRTGGDIRKLGLASSLRRIEGDMTELQGELKKLPRE